MGQILRVRASGGFPMATIPVGSTEQDNDYLAHVETYRSFLRGVCFSVGAAALVLILMATFLL
jgi:hypothetical protein